MASQNDPPLAPRAPLLHHRPRSLMMWASTIAKRARLGAVSGPLTPRPRLRLRRISARIQRTKVYSYREQRFSRDRLSIQYCRVSSAWLETGCSFLHASGGASLGFTKCDALQVTLRILVEAQVQGPIMDSHQFSGYLLRQHVYPCCYQREIRLYRDTTLNREEQRYSTLKTAEQSMVS